MAEMAFHFGAPYFIKSIDYDLAALEAARKDTTPEQCAQQDFTNRTSFSNSREETVSWSVPVRVPPNTVALPRPAAPLRGERGPVRS